jgi:hypothetical protein
MPATHRCHSDMRMMQVVRDQMVEDAITGNTQNVQVPLTNVSVEWCVGIFMCKLAILACVTGD